MTFPSLAIIGTAGRKDDQDKLTREHYERMVNAAGKLIAHLGIKPDDLHLFSGGAAWADHVVVSLARLGAVNPDKVTLFLPAEISSVGYGGDTERALKTAKTANYYHRLFSEKTGLDSIKDILTIGDQGATLVAGNGSFHARNSLVAKAVSPEGILLAYTFGSPGFDQTPWTMRVHCGDATAAAAGLKDGGTADTWSKATGQKWHCLLGPTAPDPLLI